ncbi:MAG: 2Fe-2S iron-sulfur cluster-binding protein [marine benthic group bacterium]|nr:2Fe-2S iron-sulfur cluster-binding protein [Candidatus Carthagonibacter metallireducens]
MSESFTFYIDGVPVEAAPGMTILDAAQAAGIWIPRLCWHEELEPFGGCRVCTVKMNGRSCAACTQPAEPESVVENDSVALREWRKALVELLFAEGNHFCMACEKSGNCELQALAYRLGIAAPRFEHRWQAREVDASHADVLIDRNRCILCARCVRASRDLDGKNVFGFTGRGPERRVAVNSDARLRDTDLDVSDRAVDICPVGAIIRKGVGFTVPIGARRYDGAPIGSDVESANDELESANEHTEGGAAATVRQEE